jgi:hypothetical protein
VLRPVTNAADSPEDAESTASMTADGLNQTNANHFNQVGAK